MKYGIYITTLLALASINLAFADGYKCSAKSNPERGFELAFEISIQPVAVDGVISLKAMDKEAAIGKISTITTLNRAEEAQKDVFEFVLGFIGAEDVSGIAANALEKVSQIIVFTSTTADGAEVIVYKLLDGTKQIGGTFLLAGMATSCVP